MSSFWCPSFLLHKHFFTSPEQLIPYIRLNILVNSDKSKLPRLLAAMIDFVSLPIDIISLIFHYITQKDIKNVRLTNRALHSLVRLSIPRVFLSPNKTNIDVFHSIIASENFRPLVREIVWDDARLEFYERGDLPKDIAAQLKLYFDNNFEDYSKTFHHFASEIRDRKAQGLYIEPAPAQKYGSNNIDVHEVSLEESFDLYNKLYDEQQAIIQSGQDVRALISGLRSFPNLERVTISSVTWSIEPFFPRSTTPFSRSLPPGFKMPLPLPWFNRDSNCSSKDVYEKLTVPWDEAQEEWRGYQIVVAALLSTHPDHNVTELMIDTHGELSGLSHQLFTAGGEQNLGYDMTVQLFSTVPLTRLELCLNTRYAAETNYFECLYNDRLRSALSNLTCLKHLALAASIDTASESTPNDGYAYMHVDRMLPVEELGPRLESLELRHLLLAGESLFDAFQVLTSLSTIRLDCVALFGDPTWQELWTQVRDELVGTWKPNQPAIVFRRKLPDIIYRLDSSEELAAFLFGEGDYTLDNDMVNAGYVVDLWHPEYRGRLIPMFESQELIWSDLAEL